MNVAQHGADKYHGEIASGYEAKRTSQEKWQNEDRIVRDLLFDLPADTVIWDCPVGTGRFIPLYEEYGFIVLGMDKSEDMIAEARKKNSLNVSFHVGNILQSGMPSKSVDVSLSIRLFNWLSPEEVIDAIFELLRISRQRVIFNVRVRNHPRTRGYDIINAATTVYRIKSGETWRIARDEEIVPDYRMIMLEPARG